MFWDDRIALAVTVAINLGRCPGGGRLFSEFVNMQCQQLAKIDEQCPIYVNVRIMVMTICTLPFYGLIVQSCGSQVGHRIPCAFIVFDRYCQM